MNDRPDNTVMCWCNKCHSDTLHDVVAEHVVKVPGMMLHGREMHREHFHMIVTCRGCKEVHFLIVKIGSEDMIWTMGYEHPFDCPLVQSNFPPRNIARTKPDWFEQLNPDLRDIMEQTYSALHIGADRLVAMGARAALDQVITEKCGDQGTFKANVDEFVDRGFMSANLKETVLEALDVGSAAIHRGYKPDLEAVSDVFGIVEAILHSTYILPAAGDRLKRTTPKRVT